MKSMKPNFADILGKLSKKKPPQNKKPMLKFGGGKEKC